MIDCSHCRDLLLELSMQPVDQPLPQDVEHHLAECSQCRDELSTLRESWCVLPSLSSVLTDSDRTRRIEERVVRRLETAQRPTTTPISPPMALPHSSRRLRFMRYAVAASVLAMLVGITHFGASVLYRDAGQLTDRERQQVRALAEQMNEIRRLESAFASADVRYVSLTSVDLESPHSGAKGHLVIDLESHEAHLLASGLPPLDSQRYVIWLLSTDDQVLSSAEVKVNQRIFGVASLTLPERLAQTTSVIITIEDQERPALPSKRRVMQVKMQPIGVANTAK